MSHEGSHRNSPDDSNTAQSGKGLKRDAKTLPGLKLNEANDFKALDGLRRLSYFVERYNLFNQTMCLFCAALPMRRSVRPCPWLDVAIKIMEISCKGATDQLIV